MDRPSLSVIFCDCLLTQKGRFSLFPGAEEDPDPRSVFPAFAISSMLDDWSACDVDKALAFLTTCQVRPLVDGGTLLLTINSQNPSGGFSTRPGLEAQGASARFGFAPTTDLVLQSQAERRTVRSPASPLPRAWTLSLTPKTRSTGSSRAKSRGRLQNPHPNRATRRTRRKSLNQNSCGNRWRGSRGESGRTRMRATASGARRRSRCAPTFSVL